jgi:hypothetical protein
LFIQGNPVKYIRIHKGKIRDQANEEGHEKNDEVVVGRGYHNKLKENGINHV